MQQLAKEPVPVAGAVISEHPSDGDAEACTEGAGHEEIAHGGAMSLIGHEDTELPGFCSNNWINTGNDAGYSRFHSTV